MRRSLQLAFLATVVVLASAPIARAGIGWVNVCPFDHQSMDDPIVFPRDPGATHLHDFFGNKSTDAYSTYRSLLHHGTSCDMNADRAAYWAPALKYDGHYRKPVAVKIYYRANTAPLSDIRPFPKGLKIIAGDSHATRPQPLRAVSWGCGSQEYDHPVNCGSENLVAHIKFPSCWDGKRKDSRNHKRHMRYPAGDGTCPASHPIPVPRLIIRLEWRVHSRRVKLSSGPSYTLHADFFNAWRQHTLAHLVHRCLDAGVNCGTPGSH